MKYYECKLNYVTVRGDTLQEALQAAMEVIKKRNSVARLMAPFNIEVEYAEAERKWLASFPVGYNRGKWIDEEV